jgi:NADH dehydrogenase
MPTFNRKVRVIADWTLALFFRREIVSLGAFANPRGEFEAAAKPSLQAGGPGPEVGVSASKVAPARRRPASKGIDPTARG